MSDLPTHVATKSHLMAFHRRANDVPTLNAGLVAL